MLREICLKIQDNMRVKVFFVVPNKEEHYGSLLKPQYLAGSVDNDCRYSSTITISSTRLQLMWQNTDIYVLKPADPWIDVLRPFR